MRRLFLLVAVSFVMVLLIGSGAGPTEATQQADTTVFLPAVTSQYAPGALQAIRMRPGDYEAVAGQFEPEMVIDYGSFIWVILTSRDLARLQQEGIVVDRQEAPFELLLNRYRFDPLEGEPELPPEQQTMYDPGEEGFYLVQFFGPTQDEWLEELAEAGVTLVQFQPSLAYIVRMTPEAAAAVEELSFVRWVGVYHAAYRIAPSLLEFEPIPGPSAPLQPINNVDITLFAGDDLQEDLVAIREAGGEIIQQYAAAPDSPLLTAIAVLPFESLVDVAQLNSVLWMNFSSPTPGLDDELSNQIVAGNHTAGTPFTGYQTWLTNSSLDGSGVTVAVVDTGMDTNVNATAHADIAGRIAAFVSYAGAPATDTNGHGTNVGGIVAGNAALGTTDASGFLLGQGVAPGAQLVVQNALLGAACVQQWTLANLAPSPLPSIVTSWRPTAGRGQRQSLAAGLPSMMRSESWPACRRPRKHPRMRERVLVPPNTCWARSPPSASALWTE